MLDTEIETHQDSKDNLQPGAIVNLWDMIVKFEAEKLACSYHLLEHLAETYESIAKENDDLIFAPEMSRELSHSLRLIREGFENLNLGDIETEFSVLADFMQMKYKVNVVAECLKRIATIIRHELRSHNFYVLSRESVKFLDSKRIETKLSGKLGKCAFDLIEAQSCLAFGRNTAAVFHCLRALEIALPAIQRLCKRLKIQNVAAIDFEDHWQKVLDQVDKAIRAAESTTKTSASKKKKKRLSELSAYMRSVKNAWRNDTMHARQQFSNEVALGIFERTLDFLNYISTCEPRGFR